VHLVTITGKNPHGLAEGEYVAEDVSAGEMLAMGFARVRPPDMQEKLFDPSKDWNRKRILFVRPGGFGDLLFLTPTTAEIKRRWPDAMIFVSCFERYRPALLHNPDLAVGFVPYPVPVEMWHDCDAHIWLEGLIEGNPAAEKIHAVDLVAARCGFDLARDECAMRYFVTEEERAAAEKEFPRFPSDTDAGQARVGIQVSASGRCRIYPYILEVAKLLWRDGHEVFLFGSPGEVKTNSPEGWVNLMALGKTFRESCAILETCDCLVGSDSALVHVAGALDVPCVALYGPFPWALRTKYAPETFALQGVCPVSPCFHHARPGKREFPEWGPCNETGRCEALAAIPAERVVREVSKKLEVRNWRSEVGIERAMV
jgi:ADP-heptose:LPS heptosyltransferase